MEMSSAGISSRAGSVTCCPVSGLYPFGNSSGPYIAGVGRDWGIEVLRGLFTVAVGPGTVGVGEGFVSVICVVVDGAWEWLLLQAVKRKNRMNISFRLILRIHKLTLRLAAEKIVRAIDPLILRLQ